MPKTGRPLSTKTLALRTLSDPKAGSATRWAALVAARPYLTLEEYGIELRKLAATARAKVLRLCLLRLAELERDPGDVEMEEQLGALVGNPTTGRPEKAASSAAPSPEMDEELRRILTAPLPGGPKTNPESVRAEVSEPPAVAVSVPASEVLSAPTNSQTGRPAQSPAKPSWWKTSPDLEEPGDGERFVRNLAARRQREMGDTFALETAGVSFAALQSSSLAAEQERKKPATDSEGIWSGLPGGI